MKWPANQLLNRLNIVGKMRVSPLKDLLFSQHLQKELLFEAPAKRDSNLPNKDRIAFDLPDMRPGDKIGFVDLQKPLCRQLLFHPLQRLIDEIFFLPGMYDHIVVSCLQV